MFQGKADYTALESKPGASFGFDTQRNIYIFPQSGDRSIWGSLAVLEVSLVWIRSLHSNRLQTFYFLL